ncbi:hypothetical protein KCU90_g25704, partial [Aureobasidium melanogenum]
MNDSSPRSAPRTPGGSVGGLRRWASCGLEFPSSRVKRRRVNGIFRDNNNPQDLSVAKPLSRVGMLVEKVQESLAHKDIPSSSSPLPDKGEFPRIHKPTSDHQRSQPPSAHSSQQYSYQHEDAEFDDTDITLDDMAEIQPDNTTQNNIMTNTTVMNTIDEDDDEFGDDFGDDLDAEEMENAVSFFESRSGTSNGQFISQPNTCAIAQPDQPSPPSAPAPPQQDQQQKPQTFDLTGFSDDDDDEFGGSDLDEEQLVQAEIDATQALEASTSTSSVRISNLPRV